MEDVHRFFRHLVRVLSEGERDRSREPIEIAEIYQSILPYRHFRNVLEFDTNQDYEMALLRLLAGEGGLASVDPVEAQEALSEEAGSMNPNPAAFREYAAAKVYLNINAVHTFSDDRDPYAPPSAPPQPTDRQRDPPSGAMGESSAGTSREFGESGSAAGDDSFRAKPVSPEHHAMGTGLPFLPEPAAAVTPPPGLERGSMFTGVEAQPAACPFCSRGLPAKRAVKFCPYCGQDISMRRCGSCGTDVGPDWVFCVECGADVTS